jgi:hypothetical protein
MSFFHLIHLSDYAGISVHVASFTSVSAQEVTIWAMKDVRELAASDQAQEPAARLARCAAFATAAACIAATQDKEALFANPLKMPGRAADPTGVCHSSAPD